MPRSSQTGERGRLDLLPFGYVLESMDAHLGGFPLSQPRRRRPNVYARAHRFGLCERRRQKRSPTRAIDMRHKGGDEHEGREYPEVSGLHGACRRTKRPQGQTVRRRRKGEETTSALWRRRLFAEERRSGRRRLQRRRILPAARRRPRRAHCWQRKRPTPHLIWQSAARRDWDQHAGIGSRMQHVHPSFAVN